MNYQIGYLLEKLESLINIEPTYAIIFPDTCFTKINGNVNLLKLELLTKGVNNYARKIWNIKKCWYRVLS